MNLPAFALHHLLAILPHKETTTPPTPAASQNVDSAQNNPIKEIEQSDQIGHNAHNVTPTHAAHAGAPALATPRDAEAAALPKLLAGFRLYLVFLLDQEANHLCGASPHAHSAGRRNYRSGYYPRKFTVPGAGSFSLRIPHLLHFAPRVPICKRAKSRAPEILDSLARIHAAGITRNEIYALVKIAWTLDLPDTLLVDLADKLVPILENWRTTNAAIPETTDIPETSPPSEILRPSMPPACATSCA